MSAPAAQPGVVRTMRIMWELAGERAPQLGRALLLRAANAALMAVPVGVIAVLVRELQQVGISASLGWTVTAILVAGLAAQLGLSIRANGVLWISGYQAGRDLRARLLDHVRGLPIGFHSGRQAGDTLTALARDPRHGQDARRGGSPAVHHPARRPDSRAAGWPDRRAWHA